MSAFIFFSFQAMAYTPKVYRPTTQAETSPAPASTKPVAVFRFENVSAAVFIDREPTKDGGTPLYNISLSRRYRDKEGAWKSTHTLWPSDALAGAEALRKAYDFVYGGQANEAQAE